MSNSINRRAGLKFVAACALSALALCGPALAAYPDRPIRLIVPFATGGSSTSMARIIAQSMSETLGQSIVIENMGGAGGGIGAQAAIRSDPNGYTLFLGSTGIISVNPVLYKKISYSPKDLVPISLAATYPLVMFVNKNFPARDLQGLVAYAKANPGKVSFGSAGVGSSGHLFGELLRQVAGIDIVHVPYKGGGLAMVDVIGGQISLMMEAAVVGWPQVKEGSLRMLAVTGPQRLDIAPSVPTFTEAGLQGFDAVSWYGFFAPVGTPPDVIAKVQRAVAQAIAKPEIREQIKQMGMSPVGSTADELQRIIARDASKWSNTVRMTGVSLD